MIKLDSSSSVPSLFPKYVDSPDSKENPSEQRRLDPSSFKEVI